MADQQRYDEQSHTMWLFRRYDDPDTLVPNAELMQWQRALQANKTPDGEPLSAVNYVFGDAQTAEYNSAALAFVSLGVFVGSLSSPRPFDGEDAPSFSTKDDFGI